MRLIAMLSMAAVLAVAAVLVALGPNDSARAGEFVIAIDASPDTDTNVVGEDHTVDALVTVDDEPLSDADVTFNVLTGPNAGDNGGGTTDINGMTSFTYTGDGGAGQDQIQACVVSINPTAAGGPIDCEVVTKDWVEPTPTPTPTPVPTEAAPIAEEPAALPDTGASPGDGSSFPWALAIGLALVGMAALAGGTLAVRRRG